MVDGNSCPVDWATIFAAIWFMSLLERLGMAQICAKSGEIQAGNSDSDFKLYHYPEAPLLDNPQSIADLLREEMRVQSVETLYVVLLNVRRRLIKAIKISQGTLDTLLAHPREVFRAAIIYNAAALAVAHNHNSGNSSPSEADIRVTRDLIRAGQLLRIEVVDHVILGSRTLENPKDYASLRELGYFYS